MPKGGSGQFRSGKSVKQALLHSGVPGNWSLFQISRKGEGPTGRCPRTEVGEGNKGKGMDGCGESKWRGC